MKKTGCLNREPNLGTLTYKVNALSLSYPGRKPVAFSHSENLLFRHICSIIKVAQQKEPEETETLLYNGRKTTVYNFHTNRLEIY